MGSASVKALKTALNGLIIKIEGSKYRPKALDIIINWGNSRVPEWLREGQRILNHPIQVAVAADKIRTFEALNSAGVPHVQNTTSREEAQRWADAGRKVFVRATATGHSGEGITVINPSTSRVLTPQQQEVADFLEDVRLELSGMGADGIAHEVQQIAHTIEPEGRETVSVPTAPLYTRGINNHGEYRVHVFNNEVILYQKKSRPVDESTGEVIPAEGDEADVRNLESNWVYRTGNLRRLERVEQLALEAIRALELDFGAVDIIMNENGDVAVLEVNTAVGLGNESTLEAYVSAFNTLEN